MSTSTPTTPEVKKKGIFNRALDILVPPIEEKPSVQPQTQSVVSEVKSIKSPKIDQDMYASIMEALKGRGRVFHEFMGKSEEMKTFVPDEPARIKATSIAMSVSKEALSSAINEIRTGLTVEKNGFSIEIEKALKDNSLITNNINSIEKQISDLQEKLVSLTEKKTSMATELQEKIQKVESIKEIFEATLAAITSEIDAMESKINFI